MTQRTPKPFRLTERTRQQLAELVSGGYCTNETAAATEAINSYYYHKVESANTISLASRKVAEEEMSPEIIEIDGELWLNLGSGLLAEGAANMLSAQFPDDVKMMKNGLDECLIWHRSASQDTYRMVSAIIMMRFD